MDRLFGGVRAPSTLGTFLRAFTFGHVRQLDAVAARLLVGLAGRSPLLGGGSAVAFVDVDDTVKQTYGYDKQGAGYGTFRRDPTRCGALHSGALGGSGTSGPASA